MYVTLDFEFKNTREQHYEIVCCCVKEFTPHDKQSSEQQFWLYQDDKRKEEFRYFINSAIAHGAIFVAWSGTAELRSLLSLGIDIDSINLIDAQVEFKLYANCDTYKQWYDDAQFSLAAKLRKEGIRYVKPKGRYSLDVACGVIFQETYEEKKDMQRLIVTSRTYTAEQQKDILEYCTKDVRLTWGIFMRVSQYLVTRYAKLKGVYKNQALRRGEYVKACTWVEYNGYPVDRVRLAKVSDHVEEIKRLFITEYSQDIQDCFIVKKQLMCYLHEGKEISYQQYKVLPKESGKKREKREYVVIGFSNAAFKDKLIKYDILDEWPLSDKSQMPVTDMESLEERKNSSPFIAEMASLKRKMACIKYLTKDGSTDPLGSQKLIDEISSKGRIHCYVNPYGTTTGRNAPPASKFIFAQSSWQRVLINPAPNKVIIGLDYRAQEILLMGLAGGDPNFCEDYSSGDPYTNFAVKSNLLDLEDIKKFQQGEVTLGELKEKYAKFRNEILKPVCLGLGFSLGREKLSTYVGQPSEVSDIYYFAHKNRYRAYWQNASDFIKHMEHTGDYYEINGDWGVHESSKYGTLVNWRVQGGGAAVLRELTKVLTKRQYRGRGINVICLLHDAVYLEVNKGEEHEVAKEIEKVMIEVFHNVYPSDTRIEVEYDFHYHNEYWIEPKAKDTWELIKGYIIC